MKGKFFFSLLILTVVALPLFAGCAEPAPAPTPSPTPAPSPTPSPAPAEVINLKFASAFQWAEPPGQLAQYFLDYIEENSDGRVKIDRYPGGILGNLNEMFKLVSSESVDMAVILAERTAELPLTKAPVWATGTDFASSAAEQFSMIYFENPETSALIQEEWAENNIKILYVNASPGMSGIISKSPFNSLADLKGKKMGGSGDKAMAELGITQVSQQPSELYEALSRGLVDCIQISTPAMVSLKLHEVGKYVELHPFEYKRPGWPAAINMTVWNRLPSDIQAIILDAGNAVREHSYEMVDSVTVDLEKTLKDDGVTIKLLPEEDINYLLNFNYKAWMDSYLADAEKVGKLEQAQVIAKYCEELKAQY